MAAGYFQAGKAREKATFELFFRHFPQNRNYIVAAGLEQAVDYLTSLRFTREEIDYLRSLPALARVDRAFFDALSGMRFTGDLFAVPEGTPMFPGEPFLTVRAPIMEAQIVETYLLATVGFQSLIATKAARVVEAACGRGVVEFGTRRAHSAEAGVLAGRAAYIGGCTGTSNTEAGFRYGIPVFGTNAHSWIMSFASEIEAFRALQKLLGETTAYLIDSYDTLEGARRAVSLGRPLWGVRLDSGNLLELASAVRKILDDAGMREARIMATGDLNEYKILELIAAQAPIDAFGVGTALATSSDAPTLGVVYKMVEIDTGVERRYTAKYSQEKETLPGAKQVIRYRDHDCIGRSYECFADEPGAEALLRPVIRGGELVQKLPDVHGARERCMRMLGDLPPKVRSLFTREGAWRVEHTRALRELAEEVHAGQEVAT